MLKGKHHLIAAVCASLLCMHASAQDSRTPLQHAQSEALQDAVAGKVETFVYHPNRVYKVIARVGSFTNIEVPKGEVIEGFYLSDTTFWKFVVAKDQSRVLVKPGEIGAVNSGTLVTNKRVYELSLVSVDTKDAWHQRVQWDAVQEQGYAWGVFEPAFAAFSGNQYQSYEASKRDSDAKLAFTQQGSASAGAVRQHEALTIDATSVAFRWKIDGDAPFRPNVVFDDGKFTYMRMPRVQDYPAVFALEDGKMRVVDYVVRGDTILVHRISDAYILRLGDRQVRISKYE